MLFRGNSQFTSDYNGDRFPIPKKAYVFSQIQQQVLWILASYDGYADRPTPTARHALPICIASGCQILATASSFEPAASWIRPNRKQWINKVHACKLAQLDFKKAVCEIQSSQCRIVESFAQVERFRLAQVTLVNPFVLIKLELTTHVFCL